jgi:predicted AAA+ superfamily ATPase
MTKHIKREVRTLIDRRLNDHKALIIQGARQVGKTTLIYQVVGEAERVLWVDGDDPADRLRWGNIERSLLRRLVDGYDYLVIDEAQRIENVGLAVKMSIDGKLPVKVILSGSSTLNLASSLNEPLTGRKWSFELFPLSWREIESAYRFPVALDRLNELLVLGCYPEIVTAADSKEDRLREIAASYLYKDILEHGDIRKPDLIVKLLRALAYQLGSEVSYQELSLLLGVDNKTVQRYIQLLEDSYVLFRLPPLSTNPRKEISTSRKIYFLDNGIRNAVIDNLSPLGERNDQGQLWENFMVTELYKQQRNANRSGQFFFWRSRSQAEVDLVIRSGGETTAYEFKYNPRKRATFPRSFTERYAPGATHVVHPNNFYEYL